MLRGLMVAGLACGMAFGGVTSKDDAKDALKVFLVDVEGGQATLFIAPGGDFAADRYGVAGAWWA